MKRGWSGVSLELRGEFSAQGVEREGGISVTERKGVIQILVVFDFRFFLFTTIFDSFPNI